MNSNDLRVKKTQRALMDSFLELLKTKILVRLQFKICVIVLWYDALLFIVTIVINTIY